MGQFKEDMMRIGPAPTLGRETVMLFFNLALTVGIFGGAIAVMGEAPTGLLVVGGAVVLWLLLRWVYAAVRGPSSEER